MKRIIGMGEVAHNAWEIAPDGITESFMGHRLVKDGKMLVLTRAQRNATWLVEVFAFPKPEHRKAFVNAIGGVAPSGPAQSILGTVGSLKMTKGIRGFVVQHIQSHFTIGEEKQNLPRRLATRYLGWRKRAIREALTYAQKQGTALVVPYNVFTRPRYMGSALYVHEQMLKEIHEVAAEAGATVHDLKDKEQLQIQP